MSKSALRTPEDPVKTGGISDPRFQVDQKVSRVVNWTYSDTVGKVDATLTRL